MLYSNKKSGRAVYFGGIVGHLVVTLDNVFNTYWGRPGYFAVIQPLWLQLWSQLMLMYGDLTLHHWDERRKNSQLFLFIQPLYFIGETFFLAWRIWKRFRLFLASLIFLLNVSFSLHLTLDTKISNMVFHGTCQQLRNSGECNGLPELA